jgi:hypothetical protein
LQTTFINARLRLPEALYRRLRHLAVDRTQAVSELLVEAAEEFLRRAKSEPARGENKP